MKKFILLGLITIFCLFIFNNCSNGPMNKLPPRESLKSEYIPNGDISFDNTNYKFSVPQFSPIGKISDDSLIHSSHEYIFDKEYALISDEQFLSFLDWWKKFISANKIHHNENSFDCDNFSSLFQSFFFLTTLKNNKYGHPLIGKIVVEQKYEFAYVKPYAWHMLNIIRTESGWYVVEPQNGIFISIEEYPNDIILSFF